MQITPLTEEEIEAKKKPVTGIYPAHVHSAENCQSKKDGTEMIKLELTVFVGERRMEMTTWLHPKMEVLVYNFFKHAGLIEEYNAGNASAEICENRDVMVKLGIDKGKDGFADRSAIKDFLPKDATPTDVAATPRKAPVSAPRPPKDANLDVAADDIPF